MQTAGIIFYNHDGMVRSSNYDDTDETRAWADGQNGFASIDTAGNLYKTDGVPAIPTLAHQFIKVTTVTLSSNDLLNAAITPVEIVPAQGSGLAIIPINIAYTYLPASTHYTSATSTLGVLYWGNTSSVVGPILTSADNSLPTYVGNTKSLFINSTSFGGSFLTNPPILTSVLDNQPLVYAIYAGYDPYLGGDGSMRVTVSWYSIIMG